MMPRRIAVLGAGGFIGSHLVPALLDRGAAEVDAVDFDFVKLMTFDSRVRRVAADIGEPGLIEEIVDRADVVISLTAICNPSLYNTQPLAVIDASYTDLVPLVRCCAIRGKRLVHFSTCEVYGSMALGASGRPVSTMNEETTGHFLGPVDRERWTYACAKQLLERVIWAHGRHHGLDFTIVRPFNVIGPRMDFIPGVDGEGVPRVLASFINALLRGQELLLVDGGHQRRSFIAIADFVEAVVRVSERPELCHNQVLNIGNPDNDVDIRGLASLLARAFTARVPHARPPLFRQVTGEELYGKGYDDSVERIPDIGKARHLLDWRPRTSLAAMLPPIVDDYVRRYRSLLKACDVVDVRASP